MTLSASSASKAVAALPFGYFAMTRLRSPRDLTYLIATSWLPAIWLAFRLSDLGFSGSALGFAAGYLAFISIYEIGYLANDTWDARHSAEGRRRIDYDPGPSFILPFIAIRVALWAVIGWQQGWIGIPLWFGSYAALVVAFAQHNLIRSKALKLASFFELATLRFMLPIAAIVPHSALAAIALTAIVLYVYPRWLAYMESKRVLQLDDRRRPSFGFFQLLSLSPLIALLALTAGEAVMIELLVYYLATYGLWYMVVARGGTGEKEKSLK